MLYRAPIARVLSCSPCSAPASAFGQSKDGPYSLLNMGQTFARPPGYGDDYRGCAPNYSVHNLKLLKIYIVFEPCQESCLHILYLSVTIYNILHSSCIPAVPMHSDALCGHEEKLCAPMKP
jgi:hypothetical protein